MILTLPKNERRPLDPDIAWLRDVLAVNSKTPIMVAVLLLTKWRTYPGVEFVRYTPTMVQETGTHRSSVYRALRELEAKGFVAVRRRRGESPRVAMRTPFAER